MPPSGVWSTKPGVRTFMGAMVALALGLVGWTCSEVGGAARVEVSPDGAVIGQFPDGFKVMREGKVSGTIASRPDPLSKNFALSRDGKQLAVFRPAEVEIFHAHTTPSWRLRPKRETSG